MALALERGQGDLQKHFREFIFFEEEMITLNIEEVLSWKATSFAPRCTEFLRLGLESLAVTRVMLLIKKEGESGVWVFADRELEERTFHIHPAFNDLLGLELMEDKMLGDLSLLSTLAIEEIKVFALVQDLPIYSKYKAGCFVKVIQNSSVVLKRRISPAEALLLSNKYFGTATETGQCASVEDPQQRWINYRQRTMKDWMAFAYTPRQNGTNFYRNKGGYHLMKMFDKHRMATFTTAVRPERLPEILLDPRALYCPLRYRNEVEITNPNATGSYVINPDPGGLQPWQNGASMGRNQFREHLDPMIPEEAAVRDQGNTSVVRFPSGTRNSDAIHLLKRTGFGLHNFQVGEEEPEDYHSAE